MKINPKVIERLNKYNCNDNDSILYLLSIYFELDTSIFNTETIRKVNITKIVDIDYKTQEIKWNIELFKDIVSEPIDLKWEWINEIRAKFGKINPDRKGTKGAMKTKIQKFMANNPEVNKDIIIKCYDMYLEDFVKLNTAASYLVSADYFIYKQDNGNSKSYVSKLEQYVEKYHENQLKQSPTVLTSQMQRLLK
jgi:hypothetical protein